MRRKDFIKSILGGALSIPFLNIRENDTIPKELYEGRCFTNRESHKPVRDQIENKGFGFSTFEPHSIDNPFVVLSESEVEEFREDVFENFKAKF